MTIAMRAGREADFMRSMRWLGVVCVTLVVVVGSVVVPGWERGGPGGSRAEAALGPSEAEQIARLQRSIEADQKRLDALRAEWHDPESEFARAEAEFQAIDDRYQAKTRTLDELREEGRIDEAQAVEEELQALERTWRLSKERFGLAIEERQTIHRQISALERKLEQDRQLLHRLTGGGDQAPSKADASPASASPTAGATTPPPEAAIDDGEADPGDAESALSSQGFLPITPLSAVPALSESAPEPAPAPAERPQTREASQELVQAKEDAKRKAEAVEEAEREARAISERMEALDKAIEIDEQLLVMARRKSDNANETRRALEEEFHTRSLAGAPQPELAALLERIHEAEQRFQEARSASRERQRHLHDLQSERAELQSAHIVVLHRLSQAQVQAAEALARVEALQNPFSPRNLAQWAIDHGPPILMILLAMAVSQWLVKGLSRRIVALMTASGVRGSREEREARANTLVGVFQNAASVAIVVGGIMSILQEINVPIAPLMGGAAVFGLAIAFGAQNLIRDYFYGFVILLENQYKINDVVKIGEIAGQVERITLRMTVLRDLEGRVHFIPNGQITAVTNLTHGWSRALFDIGVAYKESVDQVMQILTDLGKELREDPNFRHLILDDPTMLGVDAFADSGVVIRFFIKTRPLQQWTVKRELLRRIKNKFDELGIEIPFPHRTVYHRIDGGSAEYEAPTPPLARLWSDPTRSST